MIGKIQFLTRYANREIQKKTDKNIKDNIKKIIQEKILKDWFRNSEYLLKGLNYSKINNYIKTLKGELDEIKDVIEIDWIDPKILDLYSKKKKEYDNILLEYMLGKYKGIETFNIDWEWDLKKTGITKENEILNDTIDSVDKFIISEGITATEKNIKKISSKKLLSESEILFPYELQELAILYNDILKMIEKKIKENNEKEKKEEEKRKKKEEEERKKKEEERKKKEEERKKKEEEERKKKVKLNVEKEEKKEKVKLNVEKEEKKEKVKLNVEKKKKVKKKKTKIKKTKKMKKNL